MCLCIQIIVQSTFININSQTPSRLLQQVPTINLLRLDNSVISNNQLQPCLNYNGFLCSLCRQGHILTNGKCYQSIQNCLIQYTNICTTCKTGYRPLQSLIKVIGQPSTLIVTCISVSTPTINQSIPNNTNSSINPLILLGRQSFINWNLIQVRYPTDVYIVMIWNYLDGNEDLKVKIKIQDSTLQSAVQGRVKDSTDKLTLINWVIQNKFTNFVQGFIIDISNIYFYRLRYKTKTTQQQYQVLVIIHEINFKIILLQHLLISPQENSSVGNSTGNVTLSQSDEIKALRQQILDLKIQASQQYQRYKNRQLLLLIFNQYSLLSEATVQTNPGCVVIKGYLENKFSDFILMLNIQQTANPQLYNWMNFQINRVYFKRSDSTNNQYLYEINFTNDATVLVQFVLGSYIQQLMSQLKKSQVKKELSQEYQFKMMIY